MKRSITRYVITDPIVNAFWVRTSYHGFALDYYSIFSKKLEDANLMSYEEEAKEALKRFSEFKHFIQNEDVKVDVQSLVVSPITITYEI